MGGMSHATIEGTEENHSPKRSFHSHDGINAIPTNIPPQRTTTMIMTVNFPLEGVIVVPGVDRLFYDFEKLDWIDQGVLGPGVVIREVNGLFVILHLLFLALPPLRSVAVDPIHQLIHLLIMPTTATTTAYMMTVMRFYCTIQKRPLLYVKILRWS